MLRIKKLSKDLKIKQSLEKHDHAVVFSNTRITINTTVILELQN